MRRRFISYIKLKLINLLKSVFFSLGVAAVGLCIALIGKMLDSLLGIKGFEFLFTTIAAWMLFSIGFFFRTWATFCFYERRMKVISLKPQQTLITTGPYRISRNPLYLGGNAFMFFGAALLMGSPAGLFIVAAHIPLVDLFIRREERQLEQIFGEQWIQYKKRAGRWF
jgi:protein-S-isoprenylcysteine O-methyltransferase Ste14